MAPTPAPDTTEAWHEKDQKITVAEGQGYNLTLRAKIQHTPDDIYNILIDPNTVTIFRSIKECTYRRVLEEDGKGRRKLEVGHRALARFLFLSVTFETHLHVWEDDVERTIKFQMSKPGMMQKFDGCWRINPFSQQTLDSIYHPERQQQQQQQHHHGLGLGGGGPFGASGLFGFLHAKPAEPLESLVTLEQSLLPRGPTPPGVKGLIRGLCAHQIRTMMDDLRLELERRRDGTSTTVLSKAGPRTLGAGAGAAPGSPRPHAHPLAAKAACLSLASAAWGQQLWDAAAPINITIRL